MYVGKSIAVWSECFPIQKRLGRYVRDVRKKEG